MTNNIFYDIIYKINNWEGSFVKVKDVLKVLNKQNDSFRINGNDYSFIADFSHMDKYILNMPVVELKDFYDHIYDTHGINIITK